MKIFCTASKDTYITNKVISGQSKVESNLGRAGTLDLFKIYDENNDKVENGIELSRLLLKFDLDRIKNLLDTKVNINDASFDAKIKLFDVSSGVPKPSRFNLEVLPLALAFDEGIGRDVSSYGDFDTANFLNASYFDGNNVIWNESGANSKGFLNENVDVIIGMGDENDYDLFDSKQRFEEGDEDLSIDVTMIVSGVLAGILPDHGFRISFAQDQEEDDKTRILKRFASRHVVNPQIRPRLEISIDDSDLDDRRNVNLDQPLKLSLENRIAGVRTNIRVGSEELVGNDCIGLELSYGDFTLYSTGSQRTAGTFENAVEGIYDAIFTIPSEATFNESGISLHEELERLNILKFKERWFPIADPTRTIKTNELHVNINPPQSENFGLMPYEFRLANIKNRYTKNSIERVKVFVYDPNYLHTSTRSKSLRLRSVILSNIYYCIRDSYSGQILVDYDFEKNSTKLSYDADGLYFDIDTSIFAHGKNYSFDFSAFDGNDVLYSYRSKETFGVF
jgi:hypothetical protein